MLLHLLFIKSTETLLKDDKKFIDFLSKQCSEVNQESLPEQKEHDRLEMINDEITTIETNFETIIQQYINKKEFEMLCLLHETLETDITIDMDSSIRYLNDINLKILMSSLLSSTFKSESFKFESEIHQNMFNACSRLFILSSVSVNASRKLKNYIEIDLKNGIELIKNIFYYKCEKDEEVMKIINIEKKENTNCDKYNSSPPKNEYKITCERLPKNYTDVLKESHKTFDQCLENITLKLKTVDKNIETKMKNLIFYQLQFNLTLSTEYSQSTQLKISQCQKIAYELNKKQNNDQNDLKEIYEDFKKMQIELGVHLSIFIAHANTFTEIGVLSDIIKK